ncbi:hypothetical protein [Acidovorax sp. BLS4]|uniref:hypothetical protein n=1 Tax=Acidovorax sp. BLS4 TaxID=3273430 RepID=UPI0029436F61|nr:hypothetical protein [Paracidovorax avenae]WOI47730.1 hypothetical protein R1Z03_11155 [Paracidovorax avenae]
MSRVAIALGGLVLALAGTAGGYWRGHVAGTAAEVARQHAGTVKELSQTLETHAGLIKDSQAASRSIRAAIAEREKQDRFTTKEMGDALTNTSADRADCVFPSRVMRGLSEARDRAAAAAAGGTGSEVPNAPARAAGER